jgi:hypothetical protein
MGGFNVMLFLLRQVTSDPLNNQTVVLLLGKSGDRDCADHPGAFDDHWKTTAMRGVLALRNEVCLLNAFSLALQELPQIKGAMSKPVHQADLSLDPFIVIRRGSRQTGMEKLMTAPGDVNRYRELLALRVFNKQAAYFPCSFLIEPGELELLFFLKKLIQYVIHVNIPSAHLMIGQQHSRANTGAG